MVYCEERKQRLNMRLIYIMEPCITKCCKIIGRLLQSPNVANVRAVSAFLEHKGILSGAAGGLMMGRLPDCRAS